MTDEEMKLEVLKVAMQFVEARIEGVKAQPQHRIGVLDAADQFWQWIKKP